MVILITAPLSSKMNKGARWLDVCAFGEHGLDPRLVAPHSCSFTFVASSRNYASCRLVLVVPKQQLQCPTSLMQEFHPDADQRRKK